MPDQTTAEKAKASLDASLDQGASISEGNLSVSRVNARDAYEIAKASKDEAAQKKGRRPLFRGINMGGMGY